MGTSSAIAMELENGQCLVVTTKGDGYPRWTGVLLHQHWNDPNKLAWLFRLGNLCILGEEIGQQHEPTRRPRAWCSFSERDYGMRGMEALTYPDLATLEPDLCTQYSYLRRRDGIWMMQDHSSPGWTPLGRYLRAQGLLV